MREGSSTNGSATGHAWPLSGPTSSSVRGSSRQPSGIGLDYSDPHQKSRTILAQEWVDAYMRFGPGGNTPSSTCSQVPSVPESGTKHTFVGRLLNVTPAWLGPLAIGTVGVIAFVVLATANAGGYRTGTADQAFYIPAVYRALDAHAFPRDGALIDAQARLMWIDELTAYVMQATGFSLELLYLLGYLLSLLLVWVALGLISDRIYRNRWGALALAAAITLRYRVPKTSANSFEPYFHPRMLGFAFGAVAIAAILRRAPCTAGALVSGELGDPPLHRALVRRARWGGDRLYRSQKSSFRGCRVSPGGDDRCMDDHRRTTACGTNNDGPSLAAGRQHQGFSVSDHVAAMGLGGELRVPRRPVVGAPTTARTCQPGRHGSRPGRSCAGGDVRRHAAVRDRRSLPFCAIAGLARLLAGRVPRHGVSRSQLWPIRHVAEVRQPASRSLQRSPVFY